MNDLLNHSVYEIHNRFWLTEDCNCLGLSQLTAFWVESEKWNHLRGLIVINNDFSLHLLILWVPFTYATFTPHFCLFVSFFHSLNFASLVFYCLNFHKIIVLLSFLSVLFELFCQGTIRTVQPPFRWSIDYHLSFPTQIQVTFLLI